MIVDASAQAEQVVQDVLHSAFGSAGQRCSALRLLCLQEEIAPQVLAMLKGAMDELVLGDPGEPATDIGPVIDAQARAGIEARLAALPPGALLHRARAPAGGTDPFVAPALVRVQSPADLGEEIFGPVLHVLTFRRAALGRLLADIDATGYALTCGVHSRIDETIAEVCNAVRAGNVYVNRGMTGAVVGVQPFGGQGRSGTGPKAGGPWALTRLLGGPLPEAFHPRAQAFTNRHAQVPARVSAQPPPQAGAMPSAEAEALPPVDPALAALLDHAQQQGDAATVQACQVAARESALGWQLALAGPTGERNTLHYRPRGEVLCLPLAGPGRTEAGLLMAQLACAFAAGNSVWVLADPPLARLLERLPTAVQARLLGNIDLEANEHPAWQRCAAVLVPAEGALARAVRVRLAERPGARAALLVAPYAMDRLVAEQVISVNTAAAGGNAHLMTL
jgi:RHH-type proline utilization regulon transcriptional repressor/proline dehydrogenase/delta 1-pyrroline-5-carboxylate dehydrogenase